jgi:DNA-binding NtrC family response regulator
MGKKRVVFIVEDDPGFNTMMTSYLTKKDKWNIYSFYSGEESLEKIDLKPDIFLQDLDLPGINGIEVMKRAKQKLPVTEFIFLSAHSDINTVVNAIQLGAFDYIEKDSHAKENALNKIEQVCKIIDFLDERKADKKNNKTLIVIIIILLAILIISWWMKS